jgi:hypothetical protein
MFGSLIVVNLCENLAAMAIIAALLYLSWVN